MKKTAVFVVLIVSAVAVGVLIGRSMGATPRLAESAGGSPEPLYWVAPMDPNYRRDEPGKSPMGMDLVPVFADDKDPQPGVVSIDPTVVSNLGVRTARARRGQLSQRIETVGYVAYDEDTVQHVHTRVEGWIERLATTASGDPVAKGQLLFEIYSPTLVNAQEEYLLALRSGNKMLLQASRERLAALGVPNGEIVRLDKERTVRQRIRVYADVDGVIAHLGVREGIYVTPSTEIMSVAQLDKVWVLAEVFERQAAWVKPGQMAMVELDFLPDEKLHGTVDYVYPELDPTTRTLRVRLRFDNAAESLRPNMFARVTLQGDSRGEVVHVPREALIRGGLVDRVVVALGEGRFRAQPVEIGIESGDRVAIQKGVAAGDRVVVSGQFLIDSESNIDSALARMQGTPSDATRLPEADDLNDEPPDHSQHQQGTE